MTEKRFTKYVPDSYGYTYITTIIDNEKNKQTGNIDEIVDMLNELHEENEQLKAQLYCDSNEGVCIICKHHYVEKTNMFYISKCEKGHEKCSKESVRHCEDFKLKELKE